MLSFFDFIGDSIYNIFSIITNLFKSLFLAITTVSQSVGVVASFGAVLPSIIGASVAIVIFISVIKFVVGR